MKHGFCIGAVVTAVFFSVLALTTPMVVECVTLQSAYDAAGPSGVYQKYLELERGVTYTGGLVVQWPTAACVRGNGGILDLEHSTIRVESEGTILDIDHCVILNGGDPTHSSSEGALDFIGSGGHVMNNTIYDGTVGVRIHYSAPGAVVLKNNIIAKGTIYGLFFPIGSEPEVSYNDCWGNTSGNYMRDEGCASNGIRVWCPAPGTGEINADPLFVNEMVGNFNLREDSPCKGVGYPNGTSLGGATIPATAVVPTTWGSIKLLFSR